MAHSNQRMQQQSQHNISPYSYRNDRQCQLERSNSAIFRNKSPFIPGADGKDIWFSPPGDSSLEEDIDLSITSHPVTANNSHHSSTSASKSDFLVVEPASLETSSAAAASSSTSAALFPSIDSWIHSERDWDSHITTPLPEEHSPYYYAHQPHSPAGSDFLSSPSSSTASSSSQAHHLELYPEAGPSTQVHTDNKKRRRRSSAESHKHSQNKMSTMNNAAAQPQQASNASIVNTETGSYNVNSKGSMKDACSYDLRDHQEPPTVGNEYPGASGSSSETKNLQGLSHTVDQSSGPLCFPKTRSTPAPSSPSRFANPEDFKPHIGADPASSSLAASTNGSLDMPASGNKPSSTTSSSNGSNNIPLDPSLGLASSSSQMQQGHSSNSAEGRPSPRPGQPSFLKNTGDSTIRTPGPGQLVSPKQAFNDYEDMVKRQQRGSHQPIVQQQQQQGSPQLQQQGQFKHPQQQRPQAGDIQVPQMNLPQMPQPQQAQAQQQQQHLPPVQQQQHHHQQLQNAFQAQTTAPPIPPTGFDGTDAQLLAALGAQQQRPAGLQGSPHQQQQQRMAPQQQQQQQQQRPMGQQGSPRQQFQTQPVPQAMTAQQQNAARQAAYQGFMAQPPPPPTAGAPKNSNNTSSSTDIQVPQAVGSVGAGITSNVGTPSAGQSSLPPLPNYQSAPVPLGYGDGSFFSHQAILASLAAEENAKAAAAAAAVMGFQNGNWNAQNGGGAVGGGQQQQPFPGYNAGQQQPQQSGQQAGLPPFAAPGTSSVLGDFSFEQHFGPPPPAGNSPDASTSSRKRIKGGKGGNRGSLSRSNSTTSQNGNGNGRNKGMAAEARALQGAGTNPYGGAFNFGTYGGNALGMPGMPNVGGGNNEVDAEGEDEDDSKPQFNSRGIAKRKSASTARELAQAQQKDHVEEYEYQGFIPKGTNAASATVTGLPPSTAANTNISTGIADSDDSDDDDDGDEWVAEESDDSYGKKRKNNKRGRRSMGGNGKASLTAAEAEALRAASPATAAAALAAVNANGSFDFSQLTGFQPDSPDGSGSTPGPSSKRRKNNAAPPGSGNISCDFVDPKTGERCPVKFRRPYDQARHMETVHSGTQEKAKWSCVTCKKSFSRKDALIRHGRISSHDTM